jgi:RNA polymerase sigma factor (sigma-70 family)
MSVSSEELVAQWRLEGRYSPAGSLLFKRYNWLVKIWARKAAFLRRGAPEIDDIAQTSWLGFLRFVKRRPIETTVGALLRTITARKAISHLRKILGRDPKRWDQEIWNAMRIYQLVCRRGRENTPSENFDVCERLIRRAITRSAYRRECIIGPLADREGLQERGKNSSNASAFAWTGDGSIIERTYDSPLDKLTSATAKTLCSDSQAALDDSLDLDTAIDRLSEKEQNVIRLFVPPRIAELEWEGLNGDQWEIVRYIGRRFTHKEAAKITGIPYGTLRDILDRSKDKVATFLSNDIGRNSGPAVEPIRVALRQRIALLDRAKNKTKEIDSQLVEASSRLSEQDAFVDPYKKVLWDFALGWQSPIALWSPLMRTIVSITVRSDTLRDAVDILNGQSWHAAVLGVPNPLPQSAMLTRSRQYRPKSDKVLFDHLLKEISRLNFGRFCLPIAETIDEYLKSGLWRTLAKLRVYVERARLTHRLELRRLRHSRHYASKNRGGPVISQPIDSRPAAANDRTFRVDPDHAIGKARDHAGMAVG